jgi:hypothetical protein
MLRETAMEQGLAFGLRVSALESGGGAGAAAEMRRLVARMQRGAAGGRAPGAVPEPLVISKVHVDDGREEPIRACEFENLTVTALRDILAAGDAPVVWSAPGGGGISVVAPAVLLETVALFGVEEDYEKKPVLPPPSAR